MKNNYIINQTTTAATWQASKGQKPLTLKMATFFKNKEDVHMLSLSLSLSLSL
jgi:hypothetical protein